MTADLSAGGPVGPSAIPTACGECATRQPVRGLPLSAVIPQAGARAPASVRPDAGINALLSDTFTRARHGLSQHCTQIVEVPRRGC